MGTKENKNERHSATNRHLGVTRDARLFLPEFLFSTRQQRCCKQQEVLLTNSECRFCSRPRHPDVAAAVRRRDQERGDFGWGLHEQAVLGPRSSQCKDAAMKKCSPALSATTATRSGRAPIGAEGGA